jgi:hypothetical protein
MRNRPVKAQRKLGRVAGRHVLSFTVVGESSAGAVPTIIYHQVIVAHDAADALALAKDEIYATGITVPFSVVTHGPQGGRIERYAGWHSVISEGIARAPRFNPQLHFKVEGSSAGFYGLSYRDSFVEGVAA